MNLVKRTERGWAGHFICADSCKFRRNTLLECGDKAVVVSTVGAMYDSKGKLQEIGIHRHYETMCFYVDETSGEYKDADVSREIFPEGKWSLKWHKDGYLNGYAWKCENKDIDENLKPYLNEFDF